MDIRELKDKLKSRNITTPEEASVCLPACGASMEAAAKASLMAESEGEGMDEEDDDLIYALNLLSEAEDALSSIFKLDKKENFLSINHYKDITTLMQDIDEFTNQFDIVEGQ